MPSSSVFSAWKNYYRHTFKGLIALLLMSEGCAHAVPATSPITVDTAYYPYQRQVRVRVDFSKLETRDQITQAKLVLTRQGDATPLASNTINQPFLKVPKVRSWPAGLPHPGDNPHITEVVFATPDLTNGMYAVMATLTDATGAIYSNGNTFERKQWKWEFNKLGTSRVVVPPFTPLQVTKATKTAPPKINAILRSHAPNSFGLWDQVTSQGIDLLTSPMRFVAKVNGAPVKWSTSPLVYNEQAADCVRTTASFQGGPIKAQVLSEWDYDGMMKVTLDLSPQDAAHPSTVDSLDLVIPLKNNECPLMHWISEFYKYNYAGYAPTGTGDVWSSLGKNMVPGGQVWGTFLPYIWLGGVERGVCWFADTDKDWSLDDNKAALDLFRSATSLVLRVHLFNKPTLLDKSRRIVFGLQATPVKPMPATDNGKTWRSWMVGGFPKNTTNIGILSSEPMWGGEENFMSVYPVGRDFSIFEEIAYRRSIGDVHGGWPDQVKWFDKYQDQTRREDYRSALIPGLGVAENPNHHKVIIYVDPRGSEDSLLMEETRNYCPRPLAGNVWDEPVRSWQDFWLFYGRKTLTTKPRPAVDGFYYDEAYLKANFDTVSGDAYIRANGKLQPSLGIFSWRELVKRTATMYHELGLPPLIEVHMSNNCVAPILSFANINLDWEWNYGLTDFQTRFSPELILAESLGRQCGTVPMGLGGIHTDKGSPPEAEFARLTRTLLAVCLVHEIKPWAWHDGNEAARAYKPLMEFGYGLDDCTVYPYWTVPQPVTVNGGTTKTLVAKRAGKAIIIVSDFGNTRTPTGITLNVNPTMLGLPVKYMAKDVISGEVLPVAGSKVKVTLPYHEFRMLLIE